MICIKNISGEVKQLHIKEFAIDEVYEITEVDRANWANNDDVLVAITNEEFEIHNSLGAISGVSNQISYLRQEEISAKVIETPPFAKPDFRTKMNATANIITCPINQSTNIDYQITEERYISGGSCSIQNVKFGDYIAAEVYDKDSVIPEDYRENLCEDWPCVAKYIEKRWVLVDDDTKNVNIFFDTYPLNAKLTVGLYLRITYHAINEGSDRKVIVNYNLTKKQKW